MKPTAVSLLSTLLLLPFVACGQKRPDVPRLSGIVNLPEMKQAVFEFASVPGWGPRRLVMAEGQSHWGLEVLKVLPERRGVRVTVKGLEIPLTLSLNAETNAWAVAATTIELDKSSLHSVLELYGQFSGRTLLHWPSLPSLSFSLRTTSSSRVEVAQLLKKALAEKGVATVTDGEKFEMVVPSDRVKEANPHAPKTKPEETGASRSEKPPNWSMELDGVDLSQLSVLYAEMIGGKLDKAAPRPTAVQPFFLHSQSGISNEESLYALDTLLGWQRIKMTKGTDGLVRAVQELRK